MFSGSLTMYRAPVLEVLNPAHPDFEGPEHRSTGQVQMALSYNDIHGNKAPKMQL